MNKEELKAKYEQNVEYLRRNVPPEEIYEFAEQTYMATLYFLSKWSDWEDINEVCKSNPIAEKWVTNIMGLLKCRDMGIDVDITTGEDEINN